MGSKPLLSILICTRNRRAAVLRCLMSLVAQNYPGEAYEILVMDNGSTDGTAAAVQEFRRQHQESRIELIYVPEQGLSNARNRGLDFARGDLILFIDDDAVAEPDWLSAMAAAFNEPLVSAVGGAVDLVFSEPLPRWLKPRFRGWLSEYLPAQADSPEITGPPWPVGCNMGFRASCLARMGRFDPDLGRRGAALYGGEETDLFQRILAAGGRLDAAPSALVHHQVPAERMRRDYFLRLHQHLGRQRIRSLGRLGLAFRGLLIAKYAGEAAANLLASGIIALWTRSMDEAFLPYLYWRRSLAKLHALIFSRRPLPVKEDGLYEGNDNNPRPQSR